MVNRKYSESPKIPQKISEFWKNCVKSAAYLIYAAIGVLIAIISDGLQGDKSGFAQISEVLRGLILGNTSNPEGADYFNLITFVVLIIITLALCCTTGTNSRKNSLIMGLGIISFFLNNFPAPELQQLGVRVNNYSNDEIARVAQLSLPRLLIAQPNNITLEVNLANKEATEKTEVIVQSDNGAILYQFWDFKNQFLVDVPRVEWYKIIVAVEGYKIEERIVQVSDVNPININLVRSQTPLSIQKIYRSILQ